MTRTVSAIANGAGLRLTGAGAWLLGGVGALVYVDLVVGGLHTAELSIGAAVALLTILAFVRWPGAGVGVLLFFVPLQVPVLAYLFKHGTPGVVVRDLGYIKDAAILALCIRAVQPTLGDHTRSRRRIDWVDRFAIGYLGIATAYLLLPVAFPSALGGEPLGVRINAWRVDCLFVILVFAARRVPLADGTLRRLRSMALLVAAIMSAVAVWEWASHTGYNNFVVRTLGVPAYQSSVLNVPPPVGFSYVIHAQEGSGIRVGSLFLDPLVLGFYMVLALAYGLERLPNSRPRLLPLLGVVGGLASIVTTETRSAILSAGIAVLLGVWLAFRRRSSGRLPLVVLLVGSAVLLAPYLTHSGAWSRIESNSSTTDNQQHISRSTKGLNDVVNHPAGFGLGANPATGVRSHTANATNTENSYLTVGSELGDAGMVCFIGLYLAILVQLRRRARSPDEPGKLAGASWLAGCGLLVGGVFLPIWLNFSVALTFWGLAGLALARPVDANAAESRRSREACP